MRSSWHRTRPTNLNGKENLACARERRSIGPRRNVHQYTGHQHKEQYASGAHEPQRVAELGRERRKDCKHHARNEEHDRARTRRQADAEPQRHQQQAHGQDGTVKVRQHQDLEQRQGDEHQQHGQEHAAAAEVCHRAEQRQPERHLAEHHGPEEQRERGVEVVLQRRRLEVQVRRDECHHGAGRTDKLSGSAHGMGR